MLTQYDIHTTVAIAGIKRKPLTQRQQDMLMELVCLVRDKVFDEKQTSIGEWLSPKQAMVMVDVPISTAEYLHALNAVTARDIEEKRRLNKLYGKMLPSATQRQLVLEPVEGEPGYPVRVDFLGAKL